MAFTVSTDFDREFEAACPVDRVFALLADVPESVSHFPNVDQLVDMGDGKYRWEMKKIGLDRYNVQTIYACKYVSDPEKLTVKWTPVRGVGNGIVRGHWKLKALDDATTRLKLTTKADLEVPLPSLTKLVVGPLVVREFEGMLDKYIQNLTTTLEKPTKPARKKKAAAKKKK